MTIPVMPNPQKVTVRKGVYAGGLSSLRVSPDALKEECVAHKMRALGATAVEDRALPPHSL
ncbi:hypothetical protein GX586_13025, partial [bacterium]|nr:hypothetical protein [bacterium]